MCLASVLKKCEKMRVLGKSGVERVPDRQPRTEKLRDFSADQSRVLRVI
jgi:hypothetical protein